MYVSNYTDRSTGDLGTTAKEVEKSLDLNFSLANRWDCILLLDEADVFLAQRNKEDFQRNGLVAGLFILPPDFVTSHELLVEKANSISQCFFEFLSTTPGFSS